MYDLAQYAQRLKRQAATFRVGAPERHDWPDDLLDFVPALTPRWERPEHLAPIADVIERAATDELRICCSVPPQTGKTELVKHGLVWLLHHFPERRHAYVTYSIERAQRVSRPLRMLAEHSGLRTTGTLAQWSTGQGCVTCTGIGGALTGEPIDGVLFIDDPHKDRADAESPAQRRKVADWRNSVAETRMHPGASQIVVHTRWHPDDLIGTLVGEGWEWLNLPAIDGNGQSIWESRRPLKWLQEKRASIGEYEWAALYMGQPRPRGATVFGEASYYDELPASGYRVGYGVDLAYTARTQADYSVCVKLYSVGDVCYVVDVQRRQVAAPDFAATLKAMHSGQPGRMVWHCSGTEKGSAQFIQRGGTPLETVNATADKFVRAQAVAAAWNDGRVLLPSAAYQRAHGKAPWLGPFLSIVANFTGVNDLHDDDVDALASAHYACSQQRVDPRRYWGRGGAPRRM